MHRRDRLPHCRRRPVPRWLKRDILERQSGRCADCSSCLTQGSLIYDHRPPLGLRPVSADPNDPELLAAICRACDRHKTSKDLREIARAKREERYLLRYPRRYTREVTFDVSPLPGRSDWT
jgi:5-methylcytosine-specific restriction endonuclease McrA